MYGRKRREEPNLGREVRVSLANALTAANIDAYDDEQDKLFCYMQLLIKWNRTYNLTSVRDPRQIIARHLIDSLSVLPFIHGENILDIGSGAGLPGIPLAILLPDSEFVLLDSNGKKTRFLLQTVRDLQLDNVSVENIRVEDYHPGYRFDQIISRAFSSIRDMVELSEHLCTKNGEFLAMKGVYPEAEMADLPKGFKVSSEHELTTTGLAGERNLICMKFAESEVA